MTYFGDLCALPEPSRRLVCECLAVPFVVGDSTEAWRKLVLALDATEPAEPGALSVQTLVRQMRWGTLTVKEGFATTFITAIVENGSPDAGELMLDAYRSASAEAERHSHPIWDELT